MTPDIHEPTSRNRYAKRNVMKNNIKKSERRYPTRKRNPNAKSFSKKTLENIRGMSLRSIEYRGYSGIVYKNRKRQGYAYIHKKLTTSIIPIQYIFPHPFTLFMFEIQIFFIAFIASFIGIMVPGVSSALSVSSLILLGIPVQFAKTTYQIGNLGTNIGALVPLLKTQKLKKHLIIPLMIISLISGIV
jgi:hypothetical protein